MHCTLRQLLYSAAALLLSACAQLQLLVPDSSGIYVYKEASFKTWLLFDTIDTYYAPVRLSRAPFAQHMGTTLAEYGGREGFVSDSDVAHCKAYLPIAGTAPRRFPWQANYSADINPFIEQQDLKRIAELCYGGQEGTIRFIPGRRVRKEITSFDGLVNRGRLIPCYHYLPARFVTQEGELKLARLMDNLWLLYRLAQDGWIAPLSDETPQRWGWTTKAMAPPAPTAGQTTLADLSEEMRRQFPVLEIISGAEEGNYPRIPCHIKPTREPIRVPDKEMALMRKNEGCAGPLSFLAQPSQAKQELLLTIEAEREKLELGQEEEGTQLDPGKPKRTAAMAQDKQYTPGSSMASYSLFICRHPVADEYTKEGYFYATNWDTGQLVRPCITIYDH